ncbi:MAG TPA: ABC transporter substrate-binding protein, partial [Desulfobaccales bacterium]
MTRFALHYLAVSKCLRTVLASFFLFCITLTLSAALTRAAAPATVSFIPQWQPQAQFAGYYVAHEKGFYRERGLDVNILRGGPERPPSEMLAQGRADFGTMQLTAGIVRRARGVKLMDVCQLAQHSALMLIAKRSSGIIEPQDINGKKVGLWGEDFQGQLQAFFRQYGLKVQTVP